MTDIRIPEGLWEANKEGVIVTWLYEDGDTVNQDALVAEVMIEKVQIEINSPATGRLKIAKAAESTVLPGEVIGAIA